MVRKKLESTSAANSARSAAAAAAVGNGQGISATALPKSSSTSAIEGVASTAPTPTSATSSTPTFQRKSTTSSTFATPSATTDPGSAGERPYRMLTRSRGGAGSENRPPSSSSSSSTSTTSSTATGSGTLSCYTCIVLGSWYLLVLCRVPAGGKVPSDRVREHQQQEQEFERQYHEYSSVCEHIKMLLDQFKEMELRWRTETNSEAAARLARDIEERFAQKKEVYASRRRYSERIADDVGTR